MADHGQPPKVGNSQRRQRAPTITIETAVPPSPQRQDGQPPPDRPTSAQDDAISPSTTAVDPMATSCTSSSRRAEVQPSASFDSRDSRPQSPHNVSSPVASRGDAFLSVPGNLRTRQNSLDSDNGSPSVVSSQEETVAAASSLRLSGSKSAPMGDKIPTAYEIQNDQNALRPDKGKEEAFEVQKNPFAFSPGELGKFLNPKSLAAFWKVGGLVGLERGLRTDRTAGLSVDEKHLNGYVTFEEATHLEKLVDEGVTPPPRTATGSQSLGHRSHDEPFSDRKRVFSDNRLPEKKGKSLLQLMWITYNDKVLILLSIAAVVSLSIGLYQTFGVEHANDGSEPKIEWVEGVAIIVAIVIVVVVGSLNDYQKERQFAKLNKRKQDRNVKAVRSGKAQEISVYDILVGDVLHLEPGDMIPVDGVLIEGFNVKCDESQATGESDAIHKKPADEVYNAVKNGQNLKKMDPFIQSGATVMEGVGTFLVTSTGIHSSYGATMMGMNEDPEMTPLQSKLNVIAEYIAKLGGAAGLLLFVVLFIKFLAQLPHMDDKTPAEKGQNFLDIFIVVVTIIVVAVPEGLPLAVTLALAFATTRMLRDNNLVRQLKACEIMGNATAVCSDKTGTLTQNKMQVVAGTVSTSHRFGKKSEDQPQETSDGSGSPSSESQGELSATELTSLLCPDVKKLVRDSIALNSTAFEGIVDGENSFIGSKTETALLMFAKENLGMGPVAEERTNADIAQLFPFDSGRKCMGVAVRLPTGKVRVFVKGASEILLSKCTKIVRDPVKEISEAPLTDDNRITLESLIEGYARRSLRTIGIIYRDFDSWPPRGIRRSDSEVVFEDIFSNMVFLGLVGIQDPLRPGVPEAVATCQKAGVTIRMVTGDNRITAEAIAQECGIMMPGKKIMEGPEFRNLSRRQQDEIIPNLAVLARSSPEDKRILVTRLKAKGEIVAVTGDGTNDAPALAKADVGFSMGISGTEVAKEASSIILMDDNFISIVKALKWGRAVNDAVKRFLQFQLTVNITAVVLTFVTAVSNSDEESVLTAVQLLWVNLIMDTLAALALATDPPQDSVLERLPERRNASIISITMWKMILGQATYQLVITFMLYFGAGSILDYGPEESEQLNTLVFNTFVWMQIFKQWNARRLDNHLNIFEGITKNWLFIAINFIMMGAQVLIIFFGGAAFSIADDGQDGTQWAIALVLGFMSIPIGVIIRLIPDRLVERLIPDYIKKKRDPVPDFNIDDEDGVWVKNHPFPLVEVGDDLMFLRKFKGGRISNLKFAISHPREFITKSPSHSRSNSINVPPRTPTREDSYGSVAPTPTPDSRKRSRSMRSRSNSALGAPTVMAGIIAAGVAAGWSPADRNGEFPPRMNQPQSSSGLSEMTRGPILEGGNMVEEPGSLEQDGDEKPGSSERKI
ncbi:uncharacterized protein MKZ38_004290 [Zalerion maritima]|uniref:Calcium-transporting ATPase n=1 Tax=Zalerion maritima TaxID=339359 RepID=A0AAD5RMU4_9PEZI|nr:uncharacterized protein MKZ38_004290 [Zalerion maritima]